MRHLAFAILVFAIPLVAQQPELIHEDWYLVTISGAPAGHALSRVERVTVDGQELLRLTEQSALQMGRLGTGIEVQGESRYLERADGMLVSCTTTAFVSRRESTTKVEFRDGRAWIETTVAGRTRKLDRECPPEAIGPLRARDMIRERLGEPGAKFSFVAWWGDGGDFSDFDIHVVGPEAVEVAPGDARELVRVETLIDQAHMRTTSWYGEDGREVRSLLHAAGIDIVATRTTREAALAAADMDQAAAPEVFASSLSAEPFFLPDPRRAWRVVVELRSRAAGAAVPIPTGERQRELRVLPDGARLLELTATVPPPGSGGHRPLEQSPELASYLAASSAVQCDDAGIQELAAELVGERSDAWAAACALEQWVEANITEKSMDVGFGSALEVLEDRAGDCTEHAVLLCALARAAGIPSRVAMGLLYVGGVWAGHAWTEVFIDGHWYALDATLGLGYADALRLTLATMTLDDGSAGEFAGVLAYVGQLDLRVLELDVGRRLRPQADHGRMVDGEYVDRLFGLRFRVPAAMEIQAKRPKPGIGFELVEAGGRLGDGRKLRLSVRAYDASAAGGWPTFLGELSGEQLSIDGRPSLRIADENGPNHRVLVRSGGTVFEFRFRGVDEANRAAVDAILASIDFDL